MGYIRVYSLAGFYILFKLKLPCYCSDQCAKRQPTLSATFTYIHEHKTSHKVHSNPHVIYSP